MEETVCGESFELIARQTFRQFFASSYQEYYQKVGQRGLSSLIAMSDKAFEHGMERFRAWVDAQPRDLPVYEPVDVFVFRKR